MRDERGYSLPELIVVIAVGSIVLFGILTLIQVTTRSSAQTVARVDANQRARPVLERIVDELHSTCITPDTVPVIPGSTGSSLSFVHQTGAEVAPVPTKRVLTLSGGTLTETVHEPAPGSAAPGWTFQPAGTTRTMLTAVEPGEVGDPPTTVPLFQYFAYVGGQLDANPLPTPLTAADAARTVQVNVAFSASPLSNPVDDPRAGVTLASSATLRFSPPSEDTTVVNKPCA